MKIAFFDTKSYWVDGFKPMAEKYGYEITFFNERLTPATAHLAAGHDATCSFVNDELPAEVVNTLKDLGIKVLLLRCAGFDSVDLEAAHLSSRTLIPRSFSVLTTSAGSSSLTKEHVAS